MRLLGSLNNRLGYFGHGHLGDGLLLDRLDQREDFLIRARAEVLQNAVEKVQGQFNFFFVHVE